MEEYIAFQAIRYPSAAGGTAGNGLTHYLHKSGNTTITAYAYR